jgi:hypothetical protein
MGQYEYEVKSLGDDQLLSGLASIVHRRNQITAEFLAYLAELDERQLFLDLGYSSLFEYCVEKLQLCESTAGRHIAAARVCRNHRGALALVASGTLHASALSLLRKHLTAANAAELFELCTHQSARRVEELLAARFPRPDVRDSVRRLPTRPGSALDVGCSTDQASTNARMREHSVTPKQAPVEPVSLAPSVVPVKGLIESPLVEPSTEVDVPVEAPSSAIAIDALRDPRRGTPAATKSRRIEPLSAGRYGVHFAADGEFCALLDRVRGLAGHRLPSGDLMTLLKRGLEAYERELERERFAVSNKARHSRDVASASARRSAADVLKSDIASDELDAPAVLPPALPTADPLKPIASPRRSRCYPAAVRRAVFLRDGRQCSYVSREGRRCCSRWCLELDHVEPVAVGGEATIENLRLRCRAHNQRYAREYFGASRVIAAIRRRRPSALQ